MLKKQQLEQIENWLMNNARPLEIAKWNLLWKKGTAENLIREMEKYQNPDGGFGNGFEPDILTPQSSAISSAEAIFMAYEYGLDLSDNWSKKLMEWFQRTVSKTPSFWEAVPPSIEDYPHPPWWNYRQDTEFSPNPCAIASSMFLRFGTHSQKELGEEVAERCIDFLLKDKNYYDHDTYCLQKLFLALMEKNSSLVTGKVIAAMKERVIKGASTDRKQWMEYVSQPLDMVDGRDSYWYGCIEDKVSDNLNYWEETLTTDGCWLPNFSWGVDTEISSSVTKQWTGCLTVKRIRILKSFGRVEGGSNE